MYVFEFDGFSLYFLLRDIMGLYITGKPDTGSDGESIS